MEFKCELLRGAWLVKLQRFSDPRGDFVKTYSRGTFDQHSVAFDLAEEFHSISRKGVIRGMHFQTPPYDHAKLVYCTSGSVLDVLLDLRPGPSYGRHASVTLSAAEPVTLYIPPGIAHGFLALEDHSLMVYKTSREHAPAHDAGILWNSFGFEWPLDSEPIVSARDGAHPNFNSYLTPF